MKIRKQKARGLVEQSQLLQQVLSEASNISADYDPDGSYTGNPQSMEQPVQDADDL